MPFGHDDYVISPIRNSFQIVYQIYSYLALMLRLFGFFQPSRVQLCDDAVHWQNLATDLNKVIHWRRSNRPVLVRGHVEVRITYLHESPFLLTQSLTSTAVL